MEKMNLVVNAIPLGKSIEDIDITSYMSDTIGALHLKSDQSVHFTGTLPDGIYPIVYTGKSKGYHAWHGRELSKHMIEFKGTQNEVDSLILDHTDVRAILLPKNLLYQYLEHTFTEKTPEASSFQLLYQISDDDIHIFLDIHARILKEEKVSDEELGALILSILQQPITDHYLPSQGYELVQSAIKLMKDHLESPLLITELSMKLNVNIRTLELAFKKHFKLSPKCYYKRFLLQQVERELRNRHEKESNVGDVLEEFNIYNHSQFGASFKKHFNETPSQSGIACTNENPFGWDETVFSQLLTYEEPSE